MATDFIIKKGRSTALFDEATGACRIQPDKLIENGWYLTTDTAEVYVALRQDDGLLALRKLNECDIDTDLDLESFETRLQALESDHTHEYGYRSGFPSVGEINHIYIANDEKRTYVYTKTGYVHIADKLDRIDHDADPETPEVRIIFGGSAE